MNIENVIKEKNLKLTSARKALLELFYQKKVPICFEDIKSQLTMDKATFYRNMIKFENESLISSFESNNKKKYYEIKDTPHVHFICNQCHRIECLKEIKPIQLESYNVEDMILKGICKECQ